MSTTSETVHVKGHMRDGYQVRPYERGAGSSRNEYQHEGAKKPLPEYRRNASDEENRKFYDLAEKTMLYGINTNLGMPVSQGVIDELLDHGILKELEPIEHEGRTAYAYEDVQGNIAIGYDDGNAMKRLTLFERTGEMASAEKEKSDEERRIADDKFFDEAMPKIREFEGTKSFGYCDTKGYVTIGTGYFVKNGDEFKKLPLYKADGKTLATEKEKESEYNRIIAERDKRGKGDDKDRPYNHNPDVYEDKKNGLTLKDEDIKRLEKTKREEHLKSVRKKFKDEGVDYDELPHNAKAALLDMEFNMGGNFHNIEGKPGRWKNLFKAIKEKNWKEAVDECTSSQIGDSRNKWRQKMFNEIK